MTGTPDTAVELAPASGRYMPVLDGLRGVAILLVLFFHGIGVPLALSTTRLDQVMRTIASAGQTGVDLFFVLSGFLITGILLDTQGQPRWWVNFIIRRALRIFPLYFGALTILFVLLPRLVDWSAIPDFATLQANQRWYWTYTVNLLFAFTHGLGTPLNTGHFWSLSVEEQFYLIWPLIVWICKPRGLLRVIALTVIGGFVLRFGLMLGDPINGSDLAHLLTPARLDGLMIGAALAVFARRPGALGRLNAAAPWVLGASVIIVSALTMLNLVLGNPDSIVAVMRLPVIALGYGALLVSALTGPPSSPLVRTLGSAGLRKWGQLSYGIYVVHWPLLGVIAWKTPFSQHGVAFLGGSRLPIVLLLAAVGISLSYVLAWLSYHFYEKRFLELKRYFTPQPVARITPARVVPMPGHPDRVSGEAVAND